MDAKASCRLLAELQGVEPAAAEERARDADERVGQNHFHMTPAAPREAARHPVHRALHAVGVEDHQSRHRPAEERRDGDAREHHAHRMHAVVPRQREDERDGDHRADEGAERHELDICGEEDHDAHGGQPRTC